MVCTEGCTPEDSDCTKSGSGNDEGTPEPEENNPPADEAPAENTLPVAQFTITPSNPYVDDSIEFISTLYDSDGSLVSCEWYIDGTFIDDVSSFGYNYPSPGTHSIRLTVTVNAGAEDTETKSLIISVRTSSGTSNQLTSFVVDHRHTDVTDIPASSIAKVKSELDIAYAPLVTDFKYLKEGRPLRITALCIHIVSVEVLQNFILRIIMMHIVQ